MPFNDFSFADLHALCLVSLCVWRCVQLFETLTEMMQGPCEGNQLLLSNSRMLEAVNGIWSAILTSLHHFDANNASTDYGRWDSLAAIAEDAHLAALAAGTCTAPVHEQDAYPFHSLSLSVIVCHWLSLSPERT